MWLFCVDVSHSAVPWPNDWLSLRSLVRPWPKTWKWPIKTFHGCRYKHTHAFENKAPKFSLSTSNLHDLPSQITQSTQHTGIRHCMSLFCCYFFQLFIVFFSQFSKHFTNTIQCIPNREQNWERRNKLLLARILVEYVHLYFEVKSKNER